MVFLRPTDQRRVITLPNIAQLRMELREGGGGGAEHRLSDSESKLLTAMQTKTTTDPEQGLCGSKTQVQPWFPRLALLGPPVGAGDREEPPAPLPGLPAFPL